MDPRLDQITEQEHQAESRPVPEFTFDRNEIHCFEPEDRETITGPERTLSIIVPIHGCMYNCEFCTFKNMANPEHSFSPQAAEKTASDIDSKISGAQDIETLKLFNAGNILYGTEESVGHGEMHEHFWEVLPETLAKHPDVKALEIEVRVDEFSGSNGGRAEQKKIILGRISSLAQALRSKEIELRVILPFEYIESDFIKEQRKFPQVFIGDQPKVNAEKAIHFCEEQQIPWLSYAMLGGRLKDRPLTSDEAVASATHTALFALDHGTRECIINCQTVDPIMAWESKKTGVDYYLPTEDDLLEMIRLISPRLSTTSRIRISTEDEGLMEGTVAPNLSPDFKRLISDFNNAHDQKAFYLKYLASGAPTEALDSPNTSEKEVRVLNSEVIQTPTLQELVDFEQDSWPENERASKEQLQKRLTDFPEGIFMLRVTYSNGVKEDVSQITVGPKKITNAEEVNGFEEMRDHEVEPESKVLWVTNIATKQGNDYRDKGYASQLLSQVIFWASREKYEAIMAGVTCDGYKAAIDSGIVSSIDDYMTKQMNPAIKTFNRATQNYNSFFSNARDRCFNWQSDPIAGYWPENISSGGHGVLAGIELPPDYSSSIMDSEIPDLQFSHMPKNVFIDRYVFLHPEIVEYIGENYTRTVAQDAWDTFQTYHNLDTENVNRAKGQNQSSISAEMHRAEQRQREIGTDSWWNSPEHLTYWIKYIIYFNRIKILQSIIEQKQKERLGGSVII